MDLKGVIFNGAYHGTYFDDPKFFPIFEKAQELSVPIMLHPGEVPTQIAETYYQGRWSMTTANVFAGHGIGWHYDAGVQYMRMILGFLIAFQSFNSYVDIGENYCRIILIEWMICFQQL